MVKHYSKRASKKRAYKKRRTVKKSKNATRRKIQNGGFQQPWMLGVTLLVPIIIAAVGGNKLIKILDILMLFTGGSQRGGGVQTGGGWWEDAQAAAAALTEKTKAAAAELAKKTKAAAEKTKAAAAEMKTKAMNSDAAGSLQVIGRNAMSKMPGATPTDPASTSAALPPSKLKVVLIDKLTELKDDLVKEKKPVDNAATLNCIDQIINSLSKTDFDSPPPANLPSKPESVSPIEIIKNGIMTEYNNLKDTDLSMVDKFKQGSIKALGVISESIRNSIDGKTAKLLDYIKLKYRLTDEDMKCFVTLKNTFLTKFIVGLNPKNITAKITAAIEKLKQNPRVRVMFSGVDKLKNMFGLGSGTTPDLQATGTAMTLQARTNAETDAKTKREVAFNAATYARNKRAAATAAEGAFKTFGAEFVYELPDKNSNNGIKLASLRSNSIRTNKAATAAEADAKIKEAEAVAAEAVAAEAVVAEAKAAAAAVTQTTPPSGGFFDGLKTAVKTVAKKVEKATTDNYSSTNGLTAENFKQEIITMKNNFLKVLKTQYNIVNPDIDCLLRKGLVTIDRNFKYERMPDPDLGGMKWGWTRARRDESSIMPHQLYKKSFNYSFGDPKPDRPDNTYGLLLDKIDDLITREDITFDDFKKQFELKPNKKEEPWGDNILTMRVSADTKDIIKFCPPAQ